MKACSFLLLNVSFMGCGLTLNALQIEKRDEELAVERDWDVVEKRLERFLALFDVAWAHVAENPASGEVRKAVVRAFTQLSNKRKLLSLPVHTAL